VGPLALYPGAPSPGGRYTRLRPFQSGEGALGGVRGRRGALADIAMRRPTYL
jgi:hypothetical protein